MLHVLPCSACTVHVSWFGKVMSGHTVCGEVEVWKLELH